MKLRYQMRGLGIGIIVTALLMGVSKQDKLPLSDAEIKVRALELGMVDGSSLKLSDIPNVTASPQQEGKSGEDGIPYGIDTVHIGDREEAPEAEEGSGSGSADDGIGAPEESTAPSAGDSEENPISGTDGAKEGNPAADDGGTPGTDEGEISDDSVSDSGEGAVTLVIESGVTSYSVCKKLAELGLVEDADRFDDYVCDMGYSRNIRDGTYEIPKGATEEEILKIITRQ